MLRTFIQGTVCAATLLLFIPVSIAAPEVPTTAAQHLALATQYKEQAAANHKVAQEHRQMSDAVKRSSADARKKELGERDSQVVKMEKHCDAIAKAAEKLAVEDEKAADYHSLRAKEMEGK